MAKTPLLPNNRPIVDKDGILTQQARSYFNQTGQQNISSGEGSPENIIEGIAGALYFDLSGTTGSILYVKQVNDINNDKTQGWILV